MSHAMTIANAVFSDPATDAVARAERAKLEGRPQITPCMILRHAGKVMVVTRIGGLSRLQERNTSNRFVVFNEQGQSVWTDRKDGQASRLDGFATIAYMLHGIGWQDAVVEPVEPEMQPSVNRLVRAMRALPAGDR